MELYAAKGACSFGAHVTILELGLDIPIRIVPLAGEEIRALNPVGRVPALVLDDGSLLTENGAILPFLADLAPGTKLFAPAGSVERARIQSWISYIGTEIHVAAFRAINRPERYSADEAARPGIRAAGIALLARGLAPLEAHLSAHEFLAGDRFTIADAYFGLFAVWLPRFGDALPAFPAVSAYSARYETRPTVQAARAAYESA